MKCGQVGRAMEVGIELWEILGESGVEVENEGFICRRLKMIG
jgi:hypothetical protein